MESEEKGPDVEDEESLKIDTNKSQSPPLSKSGQQQDKVLII